MVIDGFGELEEIPMLFGSRLRTSHLPEIQEDINKEANSRKCRRNFFYSLGQGKEKRVSKRNKVKTYT